MLHHHNHVDIHTLMYLQCSVHFQLFSRCYNIFHTLSLLFKSPPFQGSLVKVSAKIRVRFSIRLVKRFKIRVSKNTLFSLHDLSSGSGMNDLLSKNFVAPLNALLPVRDMQKSCF